MKLTFLQKQAAKEIIAFILHELKHDEKIAALSWNQLEENTSLESLQLAEEIRQVQPHRYGVRREMKPARYPENLMVLQGQVYHTASGSFKIPPRLIPRDTFRAFQAMNHQMKKEVGHNLIVQSGYRSPAYQLFVFLFQLKENSWDFKKTLSSVDLPGYSEHAAHEGQALDLRAEKFLGPLRAYDFSRTPSYRWLLDNAHEFGFSLSYPEGNEHGIDFEPWHWFWKSTT
jgi:LAS superfamily LD-carboxypeptidase LdcB